MYLKLKFVIYDIQRRDDKIVAFTILIARCSFDKLDKKIELKRCNEMNVSIRFVFA